MHLVSDCLYQAARLVRNPGGLPSYHLPGAITFSVYIGEFQFELVATNVEFPVAGYNRGIS